MRTTIQTLLESNHTEPGSLNFEGRREDWYLTPKESTQSPESEGGDYGRGNIATENLGQQSTRHDFRKNLELQRLQDQESQNIFRSVDTQLRDLDDITLGMEFILRYIFPSSFLSSPIDPITNNSIYRNIVSNLHAKTTFTHLQHHCLPTATH